MRLLIVSAVLAALLLAAEALPNGIASGTKYNARGSYYSGAGACGCRDAVPNYPTVALSENAFGQAPGKGHGPQCGKCYRIKVCLKDGPEMVVKVADLCPEQGLYGDNNAEWCRRGWENNNYGFPVHFDLDQAHTQAFESAVGSGTFKLQYCEVPCGGNWAGAADGSTAGQKFPTWGFCPAENNPPAGGCTWNNMCGDGGGGGGGGGGGASCGAASPNSGSGPYWIGIEGVSSAGSVRINCGDNRGWMPTSKSHWGAWVWTPQSVGSETPCNRSPLLDIDGQQCTMNY